MPDKKCFYSSVKDGANGDNGEKLNSHISDKDYFTCKKKFEMNLTWKSWVITMIIILKRCFATSWCFSKVYWHLFQTVETRSLPLF